MMKMIQAIAALLLFVPAAYAETLAKGEVVAAELLPGWQMKNGNHMAGLSLVLVPDWKTYWRTPGDAGIPPLFNWSGSDNVKSVRIHWPSPQVFHTNGMQSIGYHDAVVLPIEVTPRDPGKPVILHAQVDMGVCKDICVPATVTVQAVLENTGKAGGIIQDALDAQPKSAFEGLVTGLVCDVMPIDDGLRLTATLKMPFGGSTETVVFETRDPAVWVGQSDSARTGNTLIASADMVAGSGEPFALDRSGVTVTVLQQGRAVEVIGCPAP